MTTKATQGDRERFERVMGNADSWATIDDLVELCESDGYWSNEFQATAALNAKKAHVRRMIRTLRDSDDWPVWASVETTNDKGETVRVYKQETLFDVEDYRQVVSYHVDRTNYSRRMATGYARRCKKRFHKQIPMHFED